MVRPQPILDCLRYAGVGRRAINPLNQRRIIRICLRAIDPLRHRPALQPRRQYHATITGYELLTIFRAEILPQYGATSPSPTT